jgi:hypothetical protein
VQNVRVLAEGSGLLLSKGSMYPLDQYRNITVPGTLINHCYTVCTLINPWYTVCTLVTRCYTVCTPINHCMRRHDAP